MSKKGTLYLFPTTLGDGSLQRVIPTFNHEVLDKINCFIVENTKSARRFIKKSCPEKNIDEITFFEINKRSSSHQIPTFLKPVFEGRDIGLMSDAGCPGVADPGAEVVAIAHENGVEVVPLVGPSSLLLALMASGFNGQGFGFNGYLPKEQKERIKKLKDLERLAFVHKQTQLFIETPYRNQHVFSDILQHLNPQTKVCIAVDVTLETEKIQTKTVAEWKKQTIDLNKRPCVFLIG